MASATTTTTGAQSPPAPPVKTGERFVRRVRPWAASAMLAVVLVLSAIIAAALGPTHISPGDVTRGVLWHLGLHIGHYVGDDVYVRLWQIRIPRIVLEILVGAGLAGAGVAFQALLRNDLAEPYTTGVSGGASVGWGIVILLGGSGTLHGFLPPLVSFVGGLATLTAVYGLSRIHGKVHVQSLLLAGVVMGAFLWAVQMILLTAAGKSQDEILGRLMGTLSSAGWADVDLLAPVTLVGLVILAGATYSMNVYALGEETAKQLGLETERFKALLMTVGSLLAAGTVAIAGIIGFVGLAVPHLARKITGTCDNRVVMVASALGGSIMLVWSDTLVRVASDTHFGIVPDRLPVGVITALLGCPFFFYLLRHAARARRA